MPQKGQVDAISSPDGQQLPKSYRIWFNHWVHLSDRCNHCWNLGIFSSFYTGIVRHRPLTFQLLLSCIQKEICSMDDLVHWNVSSTWWQVTLNFAWHIGTIVARRGLFPHQVSSILLKYPDDLRGGEAQYPSFLTTIWFETKEPSWATKFIGKLIMQMKGEHVMFSICILKEACRKVRWENAKNGKRSWGQEEI